jgi:putative PIG3 family NAD(P)H quinone oxidoreductase
MRAVVITSPGGPEVLQVQEVPDPVAGPGEVVIDIAACALNRADLLQRQGLYPPPAGASPYLGMECSGRIAELGPDVTGWSIGDEVCALLAGGGYAEKVAVPVTQLLTIPAGVSLVDAAALPEVTCTVWSMVFDAGRLMPGETILVHGGSSGIGTMTIQLAHRFGARVAITASTERKREFCRELGAELAIDYKNEDFVEAVHGWTDGAGVDVIFDNMGASYLSRNVSALAMGGRLVVIGMQGGMKAELNLGHLLAKRAALMAASLRGRSQEEKATIVASVQAAVWPAIEAGDVRPIIDRILTLDDAVEAHRLLDSSVHIGKVLLQVR